MQSCHMHAHYCNASLCLEISFLHRPLFNTLDANLLFICRRYPQIFMSRYNLTDEVQVWIQGCNSF